MTSDTFYFVIVIIKKKYDLIQISIFCFFDRCIIKIMYVRTCKDKKSNCQYLYYILQIARIILACDKNKNEIREIKWAKYSQLDLCGDLIKRSATLPRVTLLPGTPPIQLIVRTYPLTIDPLRNRSQQDRFAMLLHSLHGAYNWQWTQFKQNDFILHMFLSLLIPQQTREYLTVIEILPLYFLHIHPIFPLYSLHFLSYISIVFLWLFLWKYVLNSIIECRHGCTYKIIQ